MIFKIVLQINLVSEPKVYQQVVRPCLYWLDSVVELICTLVKITINFNTWR